MANTALPTSGITPGSAGHVENHYIIHAEINKLSRDTGRRNMLALLINGWTATAIEIQRVNERVFLRVKGLNGSAATSSRFMECPGSFSPPDVYESPALRNSAGTYSANINVSLSGGFTTANGTVLGTSSVREFAYPCYASWPGTLPGVAI